MTEIPSRDFMYTLEYDQVQLKPYTKELTPCSYTVSTFIDTYNC